MCGAEQQQAFQALKLALTSAPVLQVPNPAQPNSVFTDASDFGIGATLMQEDPDGHLHPVSFDSHRLTSAECNYSTMGRDKTIEHLSFYWPGMAEEVVAYVRTCLTCQLCTGIDLG